MKPFGKSMVVTAKWNVMVFALFVTGCCVAQSSLFTYQGRLLENGGPVAEMCDLQFALADQDKDGNYVGPTLTQLAVPMSNGVFTVGLDFGGSSFDGSPRWLEIAVRTTGTETFTKLTPRQLISSAPYATYAATAATAAFASNLASGVIISADGSGITNLNGAGIVPGTIRSNQIDAATWQAATATSTNIIWAIGDQRYVSANLGRGWITPYDCGAVGDGVADDTVALQTWINNASVSNQIAFLPSAKGNYYRITDTLWVTNVNGIRIMGTAAMFHYSSYPLTTCRIHQMTAGKSGIIITGWNGAIDNTANGSPDGITIENILVTAANHGGNTYGIAFLGAAVDSDCDVIKSVGIQNFGYGLVLGSVADCLVMSCSFGGNDTGALVGMPPELNRTGTVINQVQFETCQLSYNWTNQLLITAGTHTIIQDCDVAPGAGSPAGQDSYAIGIHATGGGSTVVESCNFENYTSNAFLVITSPTSNPYSTYFVIRNSAVGAPYYGYKPYTYSMVVTNANVAVENTVQLFASAVSSTNHIGVLEYNDTCNPTVISDRPFPVLFITPCANDFGEKIRTNYPSSNQSIFYNGWVPPSADMQWTIRNHGTEWFSIESGNPSSEDAPYGAEDDTYDLIFAARLFGFTGNRNQVNIDLLRYSKDLMTTITANSLSVSNKAFFTNDIYVNGLLTAAKGSYFPSNSVAAWPLAPSHPGDMYVGNSNGCIYMLTSRPGSTSWSRTNLIATP